jgi:hypothetical protein
MLRCLVIGSLFAACGGGGATSTGIDVSTLECPPESTLTYESYGQLVIEEQCLACHAGNESPRLDSIEAIRLAKSAILREAIASTAMPDGGDMTIEERQTLGEWLACGAP